jgi:hypothetical protein
VLLDEPRNLTLGGWVAGPVFRESAGAMLAVLGEAADPALALGGKGAQAAVPCVPGGKPQGRPKTGMAAAEAGLVKVPDLKGLKPQAALKQLKGLGLRARARGRGDRVVSQLPAAGASVRIASTVSILVQPSPAKAPAGKPGKKGRKQGGRLLAANPRH